MPAASEKKPAKKKSAKRSGKKRASPRKSSAKKSLAPSKSRRGLEAGEVALSLEDPAVSGLAGEVRACGGASLLAYREPLSGRPILMASLPLAAVEPTPFQRDLSPTHVKRLAAKIEESAAFLDPLIVVRGDQGGFWTPNGRHRLAAAKLLGLRQITALISPDEHLAFKILALNTEKAHNLKDRSLEVIRMARALAKTRPRAKERDFESEFESPELLTLGIIYDRRKRFAGAAYSPFLKKVERFSAKTLVASLRERDGHAARLEEIETQVARIIEALTASGFKSPYLRNYVVARINPLRFHRPKRGETQPPMAMGAALTRMTASAKKFDLSSVKPGELALVAAASPPAD